MDSNQNIIVYKGGRNMKSSKSIIEVAQVGELDFVVVYMPTNCVFARFSLLREAGIIRNSELCKDIQNTFETYIKSLRTGK